MEPLLPLCESVADTEYKTRIEAERCTREFAQPSTRRLDAGKEPIDQSPLFGGAKQQTLFS